MGQMLCFPNVQLGCYGSKVVKEKYVHEQVQLYANKTLFTKIGAGLIFVDKPWFITP